MTKTKQQELKEEQDNIHLEMSKLVTDIMMIGLREAYGGPVMVAAIVNAFIEMIRVSMKANDKEIVAGMLNGLSQDMAQMGIEVTFEFKPIPKLEVKE